MLLACDYLLIPEKTKLKLAEYCQEPDDGDKLTERVLKHILIPIPGGHIGNAADAVSKCLDSTKEDRIALLGQASHYLVDICSPFHTSLYSFYRQGYHDIVEKDIDSNFDKWISEYSPHPIKIRSIEGGMLNIAKNSQLISNDMLLGFAKYELLGEEYPNDLMEKSLFRAIDAQIAFLQYAINLGIIDGR